MQNVHDVLDRCAMRGVELGDEAVFGAALTELEHPRADRTARVLLACAATVLVAVGVVAVWRATRWESGESVTSASPVQVVTPDPGTWAPFPAPPLSPRFQYLSVTTPQGWLVWGGYALDDGDGHSLDDGAFFDFATSTWHVLPDAPLDPDRGDAFGVWTGREIMVMNGIDGVRTAAFNPASFTWRELPSPPDMQSVYNAISRLYLFGRTVVLVQSDDPEHVVRRFDLDSSTWTLGAAVDLPNTVETYVASSETDVYLFRVGADPAEQPCAGGSVHRYDVASDTWSLVSAEPEQLDWSPGVFAWTGDRLLIAGGWRCSSGEQATTAFELDPATGAWEPISDAPAGLAGSWRYDNAFWTGTTLLVVPTDGRAVAYDPESGVWGAGASFLDPGEGFDQTPVSWFDGQLHVWSPGMVEGAACCRPLDGAWAYLPPGEATSP
jgi:hypothetical protein